MPIVIGTLIFLEKLYKNKLAGRKTLLIISSNKIVENDGGKKILKQENTYFYINNDEFLL